MATKLKNLEIKKVDFVDQGANQDAHITLYKRKGDDDPIDAANDKKTDGPVARFFKALKEFVELGQEEIDKAAGVNPTEEPDSKTMQLPDEGKTTPDKGATVTKGEDTMFDKSKMTPEDVALLEELEKRYQVEKSAEEPEDDQQTEPATETEVTEPEAEPTEPETTETDEEEVEKAFKELHPEVRKRLESLEKFKEDAENRELTQVAKKYEILGEKPEELAKTLKGLKANGGTAYNDMIAVLDSAVATVEKSGAFAEIGKSGHESAETTAEGKVNAIAKSYVEKDPTMTMTKAIAKAWSDHPELVAEYDAEAGF